MPFPVLGPSKMVQEPRAKFHVAKWGVFYHTARLRNRPPRLELVSSDSTVITIDARISSVLRGGSATCETAIPAARRQKAPTVLDNEGSSVMIYWTLGLHETLRQRDNRTFQ